MYTDIVVNGQSMLLGMWKVQAEGEMTYRGKSILAIKYFD